MRRLTLLFALAGCAGATPSPVTPQYPDLTAASVAAWEGLGETGVPPAVEVRTDLTCRNSPGTEMTGFGCTGIQDATSGCICRVGEQDGPVVQVLRIGNQKWSSTALCHEYLHRHLELRSGDPDILHAGPDWKIGGALDNCTAHLTGAGL